MADGSAIIVVKAIAPWSTAVIVVSTSCNVNITTNGVAGRGGTIKGIDGARIGVIACRRTIAIADFVCFDDVIAAIGAAIIIVIIIAPSGAAPIAVFTLGNLGENTSSVAIRSASAQRIRGAKKAVLARFWAIPITVLPYLDNIIGTNGSTVLIVEIIATWCATPIS